MCFSRTSTFFLLAVTKFIYGKVLLYTIGRESNMIIEIEKRDLLVSQTETEFSVRHLCCSVFIPETDEEVVIVRKFTEEQLDRMQ